MFIHFDDYGINISINVDNISRVEENGFNQSKITFTDRDSMVVNYSRHV